MLDVIIPFHGQAGLLVRCLRALAASGLPPGRILLVDDASKAEDAERVAGAVAGLDVPGLILTNGENLGFRGAVMRGLAESTAEHVMLLNSDTIPTPGFAGMLLEVLEKEPRFKAVAPVTNGKADLYQYREGFAPGPPDDPKLLHRIIRFSQERRQQAFGRASEAPYLTGMCLLLERAALDAVGQLGDAYTHGYFEDLDLCCRLRAAGHGLAVREDCFVYHQGHASYATADRSWLAPVILDNYRRFTRLWGHLPEHDDLVNRIRLAGADASIGVHELPEHVHV